MTSKCLGRGLSAFLAEQETHDENVIKIPVHDVVQNPFQPRKVFDEEHLQALASSIRRKGVLQPILVVKKSDGKYQLVAGERRLRASKLAEQQEIPAMIVEMSDEEQLEVAIIENIQRENLNPIEEAESYKRLIDEFHHTQEELSNILGKSRSHVANTLRLLSLPSDVQTMIGEKKLSFGHARALIGLDEASAIAHDVIDKSLNVRQTEELVKIKKNRPLKPTKYIDPEILNVSSQMSSLLGLDVNINLKNGSVGTVEIRFNTLEELDALLRKIGH